MQNVSNNTSGIISELNLDLAIDRVHRNITSGCFPNRLDAATIKLFRNDVKKRVAELLEDTTIDWANGSARFFDLPKQDGLVRPICYIDLDVAVAYQALVDAASKTIEPYITSVFENRVLSHRLQAPPSANMFQSSSDAYKKYINIQHDLAHSGTYSHCVRLDIANYYERVYQHKLQQLLERRSVPGIVTTALCRLLRKFSSGDSHGIPQGWWPSDYLGNCYLLYLDEFLLDKDIYAIRYVDDYRIFCRSDREARLILKECGRTLREIGLNIQPSKTSIVTVDKLDPELKPITERFLELRENATLRRLYSLRYFTEDEHWEENYSEASTAGASIGEFENLWTEAIDQEDKRTSILSFALSGLSAGKSPMAEPYILDNLGEFPNLASAFAKYLISLGFKGETGNRLLDFIDSDECIHEWQQMWLLEYFRRNTESIEPHKHRLKTLLNDVRMHPLVRALTSEIIAYKGADTDGVDMRRLFSDETDPRLRRYLLLGFRLLPVAERNYDISYLPANDWALRQVGKLVKSDVKLLDID